MLWLSFIGSAKPDNSRATFSNKLNNADCESFFRISFDPNAAIGLELPQQGVLGFIFCGRFFGSFYPLCPFTGPKSMTIALPSFVFNLAGLAPIIVAENYDPNCVAPNPSCMSAMTAPSAFRHVPPVGSLRPTGCAALFSPWSRQKAPLYFVVTTSTHM
jgi:hypothetical protein